MESIRFKKFTLLIDGVQKQVQKLKTSIAPSLGVKGVHVFWLYELFMNPDGLTSAELAAKSNIDPSLVSRELTSLKKRGYITIGDSSKKRSYNARIVLTDEGKMLADKILAQAVRIQNGVSDGILPEELDIFYKVLSRLHHNFGKIIENTI